MSEDTQFAGFANLLFGELDIMFRDLASERSHEDYETAGKTAQKIREYIACRAYDLVQHTVDSCAEQEQLMNARMSPDYLLSDIPDLTTWPEEEK